MIRTIIVSVLAMFAVLCGAAQNAGDVLNKTISAYKNAKGIKADYVVTSTQGTNSGTIEMKGNKFRINSNDLKCWYDGATQWSYSTATGEVNITTPSAEEMQMSNPYVALASMKSTCRVYKAYTQVSGFYTLKMVPKQTSSDIKQILLYVTNGSYRISKAFFEMKDGNTFTTKISDYKEVSLSESTFVFDKKAVPVGTEVVDLR
ncbi:MAG: LolA-like putative outer membrane lipoprotein chaperone [Muribaculaceae bacterium]